MYETATDNRRANMSIQQAKGAQANKQKGILKFIKSRTTKSDMIHNEMINELIKNNYYNDIYDKYILNVSVDIDDIPEKDAYILAYFNTCDPAELHTKYKGININEIEI